MATYQDTTNAVVIAGVEILQDANGRYSLNALHQASGTSDTKRPGQWLKRKSTQELIAECAAQGFSSMIKNGGNAAGVWVCRTVAYAYAQWLLEYARRKSVAESYIYVIQYDENHPVKIGTTGNPRRRLETLGNCSPVPLSFRYVWKVANACTIEKTLHIKFAHGHSHGEWFMLSREDDVSLCMLMKGYERIPPPFSPVKVVAYR